MISLLNKATYFGKTLIKLIIHDPVIEPKPCHMFQLPNSILYSLINSFLGVSSSTGESLFEDFQRGYVDKQVLTLES